MIKYSVHAFGSTFKGGGEIWSNKVEEFYNLKNAQYYCDRRNTGVYKTHRIQISYDDYKVVDRTGETTAPKFLCMWNDDICELHTRESLLKNYGFTNLYETGEHVLTWDLKGMGEVFFDQLLNYISINDWCINKDFHCDNMTLTRVQ